MDLSRLFPARKRDQDLRSEKVAAAAEPLRSEKVAVGGDELRSEKVAASLAA